MSEMTASKVAMIDGREVIFRELTVAEIRLMMSEEPESDGLGGSFFEDIRLSDLRRFTNLEVGQVEGMRPSQLRAVITHIKGQNPDFFAWLARVNNPPARL
ncbi:hypothetical protein AHFPHNDE_01171 [Pseudomonas sp. MM227]|uniref:hypothetical protein n=1 Tax=Pseudomonas sp. MM227 TaxID=3019968 RepID=UPI00221E78E1|nr:hypothetical protein [Pseudomonas sp. MM227]CAI3787507.1 hypothetical protein AHFPHNDE_01171 [Pseudomonas sp. MM227]